MGPEDGTAGSWGMIGPGDGTAGLEGGIIRPGNVTAGFEEGLELTEFGENLEFDLIKGSFFSCFGAGKTKGVKVTFSLPSILFDEISASFCWLGKSKLRLKLGDMFGLVLIPVLVGGDTILYPYFLLNPPRDERSTSCR